MLLTAALMAPVWGRCQQGDAAEAPAAEATKETCRSVILVNCVQPEAAASKADRSAQSRHEARKKLESRRLRQRQAQAGLNAVEVTGERPTEPGPDSWEVFRQSLADAATPGCFEANALPRQPVEPQGLLRLPLLLGAKATGRCR